MDINIKKIFALFFVFYNFNALNAQAVENETPENFKNKLYKIMFQQRSANGKFAAFKKVYEKNNDTLVLIDATHRNAVIWQEGPVSNFYFTSNNILFYQKKNEIISYDVQSKTSESWKDIIQWQYLEQERIFVLLQKTSQNSAVLIIDEKGKLLEKIDKGQNFKVFDNRILVTSESAGTYVLTEYVNRQNKVLYHNQNKIIYLLNVSDKGVLFKEDLGDKKSDISYVDKASKKKISLSDQWKHQVDQVETFFVDDSEKILLKTVIPNENYKKEFIDIWYGNAKDLRTKHYDKSVIQAVVVWDIKENSAIELKTDKCTAFFALGNNPKLLCLDEFKYENYTGANIPFAAFSYDLKTNKYHQIGDIGSRMFTDQKGQYILAKKSSVWELYDLHNGEVKEIMGSQADDAVFSEDSKSILFEELGHIKIYDIAKSQMRSLPTGNGYSTEIVNASRSNFGGNIHLKKSTVNLQKPVVIKLTHPENYSTGLSVLYRNKIIEIERKIPQRINTVKWNKDVSQLAYTVEDLNLPSQLRVYNLSKAAKITYDSNLSDPIARKIRSEIYTYHNAEGKTLHGVLIYPVDFDETKKYPMIVNIYENQSKLRNQFLMDGFAGSTDAFNIRYYLKRGYFVFLPDIIFDARGTGWSALDAVESGVEALRTNTAVDFDKLALIGFSHGGYETNFIATQSKLFKTYLAGGGNSDLMRSYFSFNYNFRKPFNFQFENGQYKINKPFKDAKELYIRNSPIYFAEQVNAPILLWAGMKDQNIYWEQTMEFYLGLKRNDKKVIALFYPEEAHGFQKAPSKLDIFKRVSDWMDYHLKEIKTDWIDKMYEER
ncbi:prolyl oligopeptidase family serine peptidase [Chryseobacterium sp. CFS15]|uniref:alpha/beta hydrolase family protein n=1 Tax=Chryseobacterium sp. CFS15 TaxID=2986946 RepID=UPI002809BAA2|nr:prolyl oligopeptidase family serine peptidase [Chryseobacterium sp. CFS15]MDQ8141117.1 prolyl oligopeptidase family serine peptidase [Chryseobacterium sp. CFS15]